MRCQIQTVCILHWVTISGQKGFDLNIVSMHAEIQTGTLRQNEQYKHSERRTDMPTLQVVLLQYL